jgi:PAS domain S-box-containing protein
MVYGLDTSGEAVYRRLALSQGIHTGERLGDDCLSSRAPIASELSSTRRPLVWDDLTKPGARHPRALKIELLRLRIQVALPILDGEHLSGFFLVGPKLSGDPYFSEDLDLLITLVSQASIAIRNAQLYSQVVLANEYIENILATMESAVIAVSATGRVTLFNSAAERLTQLHSSDVRGKAIENLPPEISDPLLAAISEQPPKAPFETAIPDQAIGGRTPVMCCTSTLRDRAGHVLGAVGVFSDLSRLKDLEDDKRRAERLASIGALAAGIAHEIKNPLVAIKTFAELLPERFTDDDFRHDFSKIVIREIDRITGLVDRLRGLATPMRQHVAPIDLRITIEETLALLRVQLEQARIDVKLSWGVTHPFVAGDMGQLKQLFLNLFVNSIEAMAAGGTLAIRLVNHDPLGSARIIVEIEDVGSGIPDSLLGTIFDPFITTKPRGSGLGLSICRGITDAHRATIHARNNPDGIGATVTVEFPAFQEHHEPAMDSGYQSIERYSAYRG